MGTLVLMTTSFLDLCTHKREKQIPLLVVYVTVWYSS